MRNLKRVLSLALAAMMLIGMMVVGASAAGYNDFTDKDEIVHTEAVQVLNALGVIDGKEDGSFFDPTGNVTRAEMAKMITIICLGNVDVSAFQGTATDLTDISTSWAEAYIKYCYSQGIIAGRGDNTFDPTANVTAVEAAKMLLVAIGYNSKVQVYEGNSWAINVTRDAQLSGFFDDLSVTSTKELTRDEAAQMIYNAVDAYLIEKHSSIDREDGSISDSYIPSDSKTLLTETFDVTTTKAVMGAVSYDKDDAEYTYALDVAINGSNNVESAADYSSLYGMNVKVLWTKDKAGDTVVYGIYADKSDVVTSAAYHTVSDGDKNGEIKIDGTTYKLDNTDVKNVTYIQYNTGTAVDPTGYEMVDFIDMDGNGKIDKAIYVPFEVKKVTYVGAKSYTYADPDTGANAANKNFDDTGVSVYDGIAKDDFVAVVAKDNSAKSVIEITKLEEQSGKVTSTKSDNQVQIDGTWYKIADNARMLGNEYDFVAVNGYIVYADGTTTTAAIEDYVVVTGYQAATGFQKHDQVEVIRSSGETEIIELEDDLAEPTKGDMYVLTDDDNDDLYVLEDVATESDAEDGTTGGFDGHTPLNATYDKESGKAGTIGGMSIADDAVVFVKDGSKYKVITGAELAKVSAATVKHAYYNTNDTTGFDSVVLAYVESELTTTSDLLYGYVTADVTTSKNDDDDEVNTVTFWGVNGEETLVTDKEYTDLAKGVYFEYKLDGDGNMTGVVVYTVEDNGYAVSAYDGTKITLKDYDTFEIDEDTVIIYVDSDDTAGVEGGSIALAGKDPDGNYIENVVAVAHDYETGDDTLDILFVDIANEIQ